MKADKLTCKDVAPEGGVMIVGPGGEIDPGGAIGTIPIMNLHVPIEGLVVTT